MIRAVERIWERKLADTNEIVEGFQENKVLEEVYPQDVDEIKEGENVIDVANSRPLVKVNGVLNRLVLDGSNNIILEEVT